MSSLQFDFLDLSEIEEEEYKILISFLEEKKEEVLWPSLEGSPVKDLKDEEDDKAEKNGLDFISQTIRDENAIGISFFVDGGTAEDIDPRDTPPMLSSSVTPPQSDSPSTLCNDQEELLQDEEPVEMYHQAAPQTPYINQHPALVQPMNVHSVPTSVYSMPAYPPHSGPGAVHSQVYPHMPPPPNHAHQLPPTVHIENCHVNVSPSPYGNPHPAPHGALYATPPPPPPPHQHYQGPPQHPQMFQPYMLPEQPSSMPMPIKQNMEKDFDHKRHDTHNRGNFRGRGRGRGRRRGREDHERSNSVSSDHSSYSDSGSKPHYKDNSGPPPPTLQPSIQYSQIMQYAPYMPYALTTMPRTQGFPMIPHFIGPYPGDHQGHHVLAYQTQPPPATVALVSNEGSAHPQQQLLLPHSTVQEPQQMITGHPEYIVASSYEGTNTMDTINYSYPCIEECNSTIEPVSPNISLVAPATENVPDNSNINIDVTCSSDAYIVNEDIPIEKSTVKSDDPVEYIENKVASIKIDDVATVCSNLNLDRTVTQNMKIEEVIIENKDACPEAPAEIENGAQMTQQLIKSSRNTRTKTASIGKVIEKKVQPNLQGSQKPTISFEQISVINADAELSENLSNDKTSTQTVPQQKGKENGVSTKTKRRSSPNDNLLNTKMTDPLLLDSVSELNFGLDASITVYSQTLDPILQPKDFVNNKVTKIEKSKTSNSTPPPLNTPFVIPESKTDDLVITKPPVKMAFEEPSKPKPVMELSFENSEMASKPVEPAWGQKKSWSQLFKPNDDFSTKQIAFVSPFNAKENESASLKLASQKETVDLNISDNEMDKIKVGALLKKYIPDYRPIHLQPKGLINKNYWCYVNAPLQALLACPSFYRLAKTLSKEAGYKSGNFSTPFINSLVDFASEFNPMAPLSKQNRKEKNKKEPEIVTGVPFEPTCVYKTLCNLKKDQFTEGRQQDAEEMLSCVLNGLHDEMVESLKLVGGDLVEGPQNGTLEQDLKNDDQNEWKVQGPKKKSYVTRTAHFSPSPISQIFWGQLRCVLQQAGGNTTANLQPFNTLPLDIQSPKVDTLKDALSQLVTREEISGFTCPKTNQEVTASNQVMFEDLPRVLILQLKRFIYDNGGLQKVTKRLQFPIDLEITKDLLSTNSRGRFSASQRKYRLFAIVNHEGKEANKGHYVADVYHNGYSCWLRYDDSNVKPIPETTVLRHDPPKVPYLLFYRRSDTLSAPSSQHVNGNSASCSSSSGGGSSNSSVSSTCNGKN